MKKTLLFNLFLLCTLVPLWSYAATGEENKKDTDSILASSMPATVEVLSPEFPELDQLILDNAGNAQHMAIMDKEGLKVNDSTIARFTNKPITND